MDTVEIITRSLERCLLEMNTGEGRLKLLCPDGRTEVSGSFNIRRLAEAGAAALQEAVDAEREACASLCEHFHTDDGPADAHMRGTMEGSHAAAASLARQIRGRGSLPAGDGTLVHDGMRFPIMMPRSEIADTGACPNTWWP
ncbi:hypothetical protein [Terrihabitans sp. B22-R8]|uniref:hypothetical protein n=1 Tax=Terrihabitans sp. B22-R8 TaxID=3425128 RepID=UPI00403CCDEE